MEKPLPEKAVGRKLTSTAGMPMNWLRSFLEWSVPRSAVPESYIGWSGLFALSSTVERNIELDFGSWKVDANLYVMLVGPPGVGKTTTMDAFPRKLLSQVTAITKGPDLFTKEFLVHQMMQSPTAAIYLLVREFGNLLQKNGPEIYDALIDHFDGKDTLDEGTLMRKLQSVNKPCLNMMACTTPSWIANFMTAAVIGGGLASRAVWVFEEFNRRSDLIGEDDEEDPEALRQEADLVHDLNHIATLKGKMRFCRGKKYNEKYPDQLGPYGNRDDRSKINDWYATLEKERKDSGFHNNQIALYLARKHVQVLKVAMLLSVAQRDDLVILWEDVEAAIKMVTSTEKKLMKVFGGMGRNEYALDIEAIVGFVLTKGKAYDYEIRAAFNSAAQPTMLHNMIEQAVRTRWIKPLQDEKGEIFYVPGDNELEG